MTAPASASSPAPASAPRRDGDVARRLQQAAALISRQRWADAAALLDVPDAPPTAAMTRRLALNMAAMLQTRPAVYQRLYETLAAGEPGPYRFFTSARGDLGVMKLLDTGKGAPMCIGQEPRDGLQSVLDKHRDDLGRDWVFGLLGAGDGYLLRHLAEHPPTLVMPAMKPLVSLVEPDLHLLLAVFRLHDLSGEAGPIRQPRFHWYVGDDWLDQLIRELDEDLYLPPPQYCILQGPDAQPLAEALRRVSKQKMDAIGEVRDRLEEDYGKRTAAEYAQLFGPTPPRPPRLLLMTSRFTTVLQHSTRDTAAAFEKLGWETHIQIEPDDDHRCWNGGLVRLIDRFRPDAVFSIDHLRTERDQPIPPGVPFISWTQDHLPNLTNVDAGKSIGLRDFVLSIVKPMYTSLWGYPDRQFVDVPKLTAVPVRPTTWAQDGPDLVYVSTASADPAQLADELVASVPEGNWLRPIVRACCDRVLRIYADGGSLPTLWHMGGVVDGVARERDVRWETPGGRATVINRLFHPLNNALYRQQALRWVIDAAEDLDLTLELYGGGWEKRPEYAPYARGWVHYGTDLEDLTRRAKINLQIIPALSLHQRLLDGLVAGGFFLVRDHASDGLFAAVAAFLAEHAPDAETMGDARQRAGAEHVARFDALIREAESFCDLGMPIDLVGWVQCCRRGGLFDDEHRTLPRLDEISFHDAASVRARLERFAHDRELRDAIANEQRRSVEHRLSYVAGMRRAVAVMHQRLSEEARDGDAR